jgi:hypothetical protein
MANPAIQVPVAIVIFALIGIPWGLVVWRFSEKEFRSHEQQTSSQETLHK